MATNTVVRARVDEALKAEASAILEASGLTLSDAFRMMLVRTVADRALPFDPLVPNEDTIAAIKEARARGLSRAETVDELLGALNADD